MRGGRSRAEDFGRIRIEYSDYRILEKSGSHPPVVAKVAGLIPVSFSLVYKRPTMGLPAFVLWKVHALSVSH